MASKNNKKKYGFSSLSIYRVADEEIGKLKNNRIHYTYQNNQNKNKDNKAQQNLNKSEQINQRYNSIEKNNRNKNPTKINHSSMNGVEKSKSRNKNKVNILRISNSSKDKVSNKISAHTYKSKPIQKRNNGLVDRIIIDLVSNNEENLTMKSDSNFYENVNISKGYINNKDNNSEVNNYENKDNNQIDSLQTALDMVGNRWANDCEISQEFNYIFLSNEINKKKKEIENIINNTINNSKTERKIVKEINLSLIKNNKWIKEKEINNTIKRWNNEIKKQINKCFTIFKTIDKNKFLYSEKNYIEDLAKNIYLPKKSNDIFCILSKDNFIDDFNKIDYKIIKPDDKTQLEKDLFNYYQERNINYLKNKDNNEDLKINPIYVLNTKQIKHLYEGLNLDKNENNRNDYLNTQLSIARQTAIDYEIIEVFTPKNTNIDNNSNISLSRRTIISENDKVNEGNYNGNKRQSEDFGQYTPISMLNDKFRVYAVSRNIKYSIPERQGFLNYNNFKKKGFDDDCLKRNNFSLKIVKCEKLDSFKSSKESTKRNDESIDRINNNIIDYSRYSNNSNKSLGKNFKNK